MSSKKPRHRAGADLDGLRRFAMSTDRELSPIFVGREAELACFDEAARNVLADWRDGRPVGGRTTVVVGCPGMGKSALLEHFGKTRCNRKTPPDSPLAAKVDIDDLRDRNAVAERLRDAARTDPAWKELIGAGLELVGNWLKARPILEAARRRTPDLFSRIQPVCVIVDEVQNAGPEHRPGASALQTGTLDLPILPLYAGLNDSFDALRTAGISRLARNATVHLGLLSREEAREAVETLLGRYHVVKGGSDERVRWIDAVAADSAGFPQHLHIGMQEVARVLADRGMVLDSEGLDEARRRAAEGRKGYYRSRLSSSMQKHPAALLAVVRATVAAAGPVHWNQLDAAAFCHLRARHNERGGKAPDSEAFVDEMIHEGVLQMNADGRGYEVPMPSMSTWLLNDYARECGIGP